MQCRHSHQPQPSNTESPRLQHWGNNTSLWLFSVFSKPESSSHLCHRSLSIYWVCSVKCIYYVYLYVHSYLFGCFHLLQHWSLNSYLKSTARQFSCLAQLLLQTLAEVFASADNAQCTQCYCLGWEPWCQVVAVAVLLLYYRYWIFIMHHSIRETKSVSWLRW